MSEIISDNEISTQCCSDDVCYCRSHCGGVKAGVHVSDSEEEEVHTYSESAGQHKVMNLTLPADDDQNKSKFCHADSRLGYSGSR